MKWVGRGSQVVRYKHRCPESTWRGSPHRDNGHCCYHVIPPQGARGLKLVVNPRESSPETFVVFLKSSHRPRSLHHANIRKARCPSCERKGTKTWASSSPACTPPCPGERGAGGRLSAPTTAQPPPRPWQPWQPTEDKREQGRLGLGDGGIRRL